MASINKATVLGNVGCDPEVKRNEKGDPTVVVISVATSESWKDKETSERKEKTEWHRVVIFNPILMNVAIDYISKGTRVYAEGQLSSNKWIDKNGIQRYSTEIVLRNRANLIICDFGDKKRKLSKKEDKKEEQTE
ncbi:MAG: single-stranded DNA-binding protein [Culicoidibacterales bacterium]